MSRVFVIAECGSCWRFGDQLVSARRMIRLAKDCDADAAKFQWTSDAAAMAKRRELPNAEEMYRRYVHFPSDWLPELKAMCDNAGIEFMCTVYLPQDIPTIAPLVKRFKVSAFESEWKSFVFAHQNPYQETIVSSNPGKPAWYGKEFKSLYCISEYPCSILQLGLSALSEEYWNPMNGFLLIERKYNGLSDHTTSVISGAVAVGAGATIIEKHVRLGDTPEDCPDYGHSLQLDCECGKCFPDYVANIREAEVMM